MFINRKDKDTYEAFNSNSSERLKEGTSVLYDAISKNLKNQLCATHHKHYEYFYKESLLCELCFQNELSSHGKAHSYEQIQKYQYFYHLRSIMNYPIILLAEEESLFQYPIQIIDLLLKSYQPLYSKKSDLDIQKSLLKTYINRIKNRINSLCDQLLACFDVAESNLSSIGSCRDEMKHISKIYEQQFLQLLEEKYANGRKQQLEEVFTSYKTRNECPFDKICSNLDEVMSYLSQSPIIDIQQLANLYTKITDERLWKCNKIISTKDEESKNDSNTEMMIMNSDQVVLQGQYVLQMSQDRLILKKQERQIGKIDVAFDSLYHLNRYRLIGVNYDSIQIISYFDRLVIDEVFPIQGCTDILAFDNDIIAISNQKLLRIDLFSKKYTVIGTNYKELRYISKEKSLFSCQNEQGKRVNCNLKSNGRIQNV